jgi:hypothetical protein
LLLQPQCLQRHFHRVSIDVKDLPPRNPAAMPQNATPSNNVMSMSLLTPVNRR